MEVGWVMFQVALLAVSCHSQETVASGFFNEFVKLVESALDIIFSSFYGKREEDVIRYKGFQLFRIFPRSENQVEDLQDILDEDDVQYWTPMLKNHTTDILLPPDLIKNVKDYLKREGIEYSVVISNLHKAIISQQNPKQIKEDKVKNDHPLTFQKYHRYQDIMDYLSYLEENFSNLVQLKTIGTSSEGRTLKVVKISPHRPNSNKTRPAIWIDAGAHGREWISPATALFVIKQLVQGFESNRRLVNKLDWYIMPLLNPDGYEYTHMKDRFWRKNMSPVSTSAKLRSIFSTNARFLWDGSKCQGVDLNRNWGYHWGQNGESANPCRDTYPGSKAFSEPETKAVSKFIMDIKNQLKVYLSLHAYSQMWRIPWSHTNKVKDYDDLIYMGKQAVNAINKIYGTKFDLGTAPSLIQPIGGRSDDWAKSKAGVKYSYMVELRDKSKYGFLLPASEIIPTGRETFAGIRAIAKSIIDDAEL